VENRLLQQQNRIHQLEISEQTEIRNLYYTLALLALLIAALLFLHSQREKQSTNKMTVLAMTDELTGIPNRRQIFSIGADELSRSHRYRHPLTIGVIDLDDFKTINDEYGHDVGDLVLIEFTRAISIALREQDKIGRIGGEEFLVVFPNTSAQELLGIMQRAQQQVKDSSLSIVGRGLTFSIGAAEMIESDLELKSILKRADMALYEAKENGKDQCLIASNNQDGTLVTDEV
jgi:diguanylate cyclase (GGDEF)-like protein